MNLTLEKVATALGIAAALAVAVMRFSALESAAEEQKRLNAELAAEVRKTSSQLLESQATQVERIHALDLKVEALRWAVQAHEKTK